MADEATIRSTLQIRKMSGNIALIDYNSQPAGFVATVAGTKGPVPGSMSASTSGSDVSLTQLTTPGLCRIMNQDATNFVTVGIQSGGTFYPLAELLPGESYVLRLSRTIGTLRVKANTASVNVLVEVFEA